MTKILQVLLPALLIGPLLLETRQGLECKSMKSTEKIVDGPYVSYRQDWVYVQYILEKNGSKLVKTDSFPLKDRSTIRLTAVNTDSTGGAFVFNLKDKLENEKTEYNNVSKQFALSDIEGNFPAFRRLLIAGGVIDSSYNWTFGNGHLVLTGDFFDRGQQVTEVLWLIYALEEKAKEAGGYVHFVLGNHEIMNLSGDLRYVHQKYLGAAALLGIQYMQLFDANSELGRWLRTKNIIEKIGNVLYAHGGISSEMNKLGLPVDTVNGMARPYYHDSLMIYPDPRLDTIMLDQGPFWYRGYYTGLPKATMQQVDSSFILFGVKLIVTGHTVVSDKVSAWFDRKVINTDVPHYKGVSEALYMEGDKLFRVKTDGSKEPL